MSLISNWVAFAIQKKIYFSNKHSPLSFLVLPVVSPFLNTLLLFFNSLGSLLPFFEHTSTHFSCPLPLFLFCRLPLALEKKYTFQSHFQWSPLFFFSYTFSCLPFFLPHLQLSPKHSPFFYSVPCPSPFQKISFYPPFHHLISSPPFFL